MAEALGFTLAVLADIWFLHSKTYLGDALVFAFALTSLIVHRVNLKSLAPPVLLALAVFPIPGGAYLSWCLLQQVLLQHLIYLRVRSSLGPTWTASIITGALFAIAHLPNPILVPATFVWGIISTRIFERHTNIIVLGIAQTILSGTLLWLTPLTLNHRFRVGPGYWRYPAITAAPTAARARKTPYIERRT